MRKRNLIILSAAVVLALCAYGTRQFMVSRPKVEVTRKFKLPLDGSYKIAQADGVKPRILEAKIDPPDVHVGDMQRLSVVVEDDVQVVSVEAVSRLDRVTTTIPLKLIAEDPLRYEAEWKVYDTHDTTYSTTFTARDVLGRTSQVVLAWSDACGIPNSGNWTSSSNCTISSPDGVELGTTTISSGTLTLNADFAFNTGYSFLVTSGTVAVGSGSLKKAYVWKQDFDGDTYPNATMVVSTTSPGSGQGYARRSSFSNADDCDDTDANYWRTITPAYIDQDQDQYSNTANTYAPCLGNLLSNGSATWGTDKTGVTYITSGRLGNDANDGNASVH